MVIIGAAASFGMRHAPVRVGAFVRTYDHRTVNDPFEVLLVQSDGQAFAALARDPLLRRPDVFPSRAEAAYRAQRMLLPWLAWAGSGGRSGWVPPALAAISVLATAAAAAGLAALLHRLGGPTWPAALLPIVPGAQVSLAYFGPELLVLALVVWGYLLWSRTPPTRSHVGWALALFALGALARETGALVAGALALHEAVHRRWGRATLLGATLAPLVAWLLFLRVRLGAWPTGAGATRLEAPFVGLIRGVQISAAPLSVVVIAALGAVSVLVVVAVLGWRHELTIVALAHAGFGVVLGRAVWVQWEFPTRVLLTLYGLGLVALAVLARRVGSERPPPTAADLSPTEALPSR